MRLIRLLLGRPLANEERETQKLGLWEGVPALGLDGLASSAYGPEAALTILMRLGILGSHLLIAVMVPVLVLLGILFFSYRQTIAAYPNNGGAYVVAKENLGTGTSLLAAAAIMIDYILNAAVAISSGVGQITSAIPVLQPYTLAICLIILAAITFANLRGLAESSRIFAIPTYLFIASFLAVIAVGISRSLAGPPAAVIPPPAPPAASEALGLWLLMRSFAAGCTAMTGIEAVSNSVNAFCEPVVPNARRTLAAIVGTLACLLAGIAWLVPRYSIAAMNQSQSHYQSVLSQLASAAIGRGAFYYVAMTAAVCVLCLSANTSFAGLPLLCRRVAQDGFLPRAFTMLGRRLVFSVGIISLALTAAILLVVFDGITDRLIPLFAIGAFLTFTLSQSGMVVHWLKAMRRGEPGWQLSLVINGIGALATAAATIVIVTTKFLDGAWITILIIPIVIALLKSVHLYYARLDARLRCDEPLRPRNVETPLVLVATEGWNRLTDRALGFALGISSDVIAVHLIALVGDDELDRERADSLRQDWARYVTAPAEQAGMPVPQLEMVQAPYRNLHLPLLKLIERLRSAEPDRTIAVLVPEVVKQHWWQSALHTHRAWRLRAALLRYGGPGVVVMSVPWYLEPPKMEDAAEEPELTPAAHPEPAESGTAAPVRDYRHETAEQK